VAESLNHDCIYETESRIAKAKAAFSNKKTLSTRKMDLHLRKKLIKCHIWSTDLYGVAAWTLREGYHK